MCGLGLAQDFASLVFIYFLGMLGAGAYHEDLRGGKAGQGRVGHEPDQTAAAAEDKIEPGVVENMRSWAHTGFRVDQSVRLPAGDQTGIER